MTRTRPDGRGQSARRPAAEVRPPVAVARPWLAGAVTVGLGQAVLLIDQAGVLAGLLAGALSGTLTAQAAIQDSLRVALLAAGQGLLGWMCENLCRGGRAAGQDRHSAPGAGDGHPPGRVGPVRPG